MGFQTDCIATAEDREQFFGSVPPPIYETSLFTFPSYADFREAFSASIEGAAQRPVYTRGSNPTVRAFEQKIALLERGDEARAFASGMAAILAAVLSGAGAGDHIIAIQSIYSNAYRLLNGYLPRLGIETDFVDFTRLDVAEAAIRPNTRLLYLESPGNPAMHLVDIPATVAMARRHGLITVMDNTLATPFNQRPLADGVDLVVHSASKYISGHSDVVAGVVVGGAERIHRIAAQELHDLGGIIGPFEAWLLLRGLRTMGLRMRAHNEAALHIAGWLERQPQIERVFYPVLASHPQYSLARRQMCGFSGMLSVVVRGGMEAAVRFADHLQLFGIGVSWGGFESLALPIDVEQFLSPEICSDLGVVPGFVRLSIGLEDVDDLLADLRQALEELDD